MNENMITLDECNYFLLKNHLYFDNSKVDIYKDFENMTLDDFFYRIYYEVIPKEIEVIVSRGNDNQQSKIIELLHNVSQAQHEIDLFEKIKENERQRNIKYCIEDVLKDCDFSIDTYDEKIIDISKYTDYIDIEKIVTIDIDKGKKLNEPQKDEEIYKALKKYVDEYDIDKDVQYYTGCCVADGYSIKQIYEDLESFICDLRTVTDVYQKYLKEDFMYNLCTVMNAYQKYINSRDIDE